MKKSLLILALLSNFIYPQQSRLSKEVNAVSKFVASDYFSAISGSISPLSSLDSIYVRALKICNGDIQETLLALTFAMVPYRLVPIKLPTTGITLDYPLVSADLETFEKKNKNIPRELYFDTPVYGDNDKPTHFFGSAFISYSSNIFDLGDFIGYFVEVFEETFKVQSQIDKRDIETNRLGNLFGDLLKKNEKIMPSQLFLMKTYMHIRMNL